MSLGSWRNSRRRGSLVISGKRALRHIWDDDVLARRDPHFAVAVAASDPRQARQLVRGNAPHRHVEPDCAHSRLFLPRDAEVIVMPVGPGVASLRQQPFADAPLELAPELVDSPLFDEKRQPRAIACAPRAVVAKHQRDMTAQCRRVFGTAEDAKRRRRPKIRPIRSCRRRRC